MASQAPYSINLDMRYAPLELVDVQALVDRCKDAWYNQSLCRVNDCVVRLGVMQGEFHWHVMHRTRLDDCPEDERVDCLPALPLVWAWAGGAADSCQRWEVSSGAGDREGVVRIQ